MRPSTALMAAGLVLLFSGSLAAQVLPLAVVIVDTTPPAVEALSPENNSTLYVGQKATFKIRATDAASGVSMAVIRVWTGDGKQNVAGQVWSNIGGLSSFEATYEWTPASEGSYYAVYGAEDAVGWQAPLKYIYFTVGRPATYSVTISAGAGGTTDPSPGTYTYTKGQQVTIRALPNNGYEFAGWTVDGATRSENPLTLTVDRNMSVSAGFRPKLVFYTLTAAASPPQGGSVVDENGTVVTSRSLLSGTSIRLWAKPAGGYKFVKWSGDAGGTGNPVEVLVNGNKSVTAEFELETAPSGTLYICGKEVAADSAIVLPTRTLDFLLSVKPEDAERVSGAYVMVDSQRVNLTRSGAAWSGTWTAPSDGQYNITCKIQWAGGEVKVASVTMTLQTAVDNRPPLKVMVAVGSQPVEGGTVSGNFGQVDRGTLIQLTAYPNEGYRFSYWTSDAVSFPDPSLNPISFVANSDATVKAVFEEEAKPPVPPEMLRDYLGPAMLAVGAVLFVLALALRAKGR
mgnify:FL=1